MNTDEPTHQSRACEECGKPFDCPGMNVQGHVLYWQKICNTCHPIIVARRQREHEDLARRQREAEWLTICPKEFQQIDHRLLPDPDLFERVQAWSYGPRGMFVAGKTGLAKTRACWALLHREFMAGRSVRVLTPYDLARWPAQVFDDARRADAELERLVRAKIFYLDDPFKSRLTPTVEELLFVALDERASRQLPCIFSSNDSAATLLERLSTDRANAFLRRIRDFCEVVQPNPAGEAHKQP